MGRGDIDALEVAGQAHPHLGAGHPVEYGQPRHAYGIAIDLGQPSQMAGAMLDEPLPESVSELGLSQGRFRPGPPATANGGGRALLRRLARLGTRPPGGR
jgi:hypothetical protein